MSLLGWIVGAMVLGEFGSNQEEMDRQKRELYERDRRIEDLESRLRRLESGRYGLGRGVARIK